MKSKQILTIVSGSALASGMAHGAVLYSGLVNSTFPCPTGGPASAPPFDVNNDGIDDFYIGFDGFTTANAQKPYIIGYASDDPGSTVLARLNVANNDYGLPVTLFASMIDSNYLAPILNDDKAYFDQDGGGHYIGDWTSNERTEGYVGLELWDATGTTNNYAWAHLIYDATGSPVTLTLVDYAYETVPFTGIIAGATNDSGIPDIYVQPQSQTNGVGASVTYSVTMLANPPPTYQWQAGPASGLGPYTNLSDGGTISGSTNATLTLDGVIPANELAYQVVITNSLGSITSAPATLTLTPPVVAPAAPILFAGFTANLNVTITGGLTPAYQWQFDGVNLTNGGRISGATSSVLQISNLQTNDAGSYNVVLSFVGSSPSTSTTSILTILPQSQETLYDAAVLADNPSVYYRLNESGNPANSNLVAYDNAGGFNGVYGIDVTNGFDGIQGPNASNGFPGFSISNAAVLISPNDTNSWIILPPWLLNTNTVTFTAWVNPASNPPPVSGIVMTTSVSNQLAGIDYYFEADTNGNEDLGYRWDQGTNSSLDDFYSSGLVTPNNEWSFVAVAITATNASLYVFNAQGTNYSVEDVTPPNADFAPDGATNLVMPFNVPEYIGTDATGAYGSQNFDGMIDSVAVFNQALTLNQLTTLYNAALGSLPVQVQISISGTSGQITWPVGTLLQSTSLNGPWTPNYLATSPYTFPLTGTMMFYKVVVP